MIIYLAALVTGYGLARTMLAALEIWREILAARARLDQTEYWEKVREAATKPSKGLKPFKLATGGVVGCPPVSLLAGIKVTAKIGVDNDKTIQALTEMVVQSFTVPGETLLAAKPSMAARDLIVIRGEIPTSCPLCRGRAMSTRSQWSCTKCGVAGRVVA